MPLDPKAVKAAQEELDSKSGSDFFLRLKENDVKDIRVLEPSPAMAGNWYIEVPIYWIGKVRVVGNELSNGEDIVEKIMTDIEADFAKTNEQKDFNTLRNRTDGKFNAPVIRKQYEYWVPVLEFAWDVDTQDQIVGIYDEKGNVDPNLVKKFVSGGKPKILDAKVSLIKQVNKVITARGGYDMPDPVKGFNLSISRTGTGRDTVYSATKTESMPMPSEFYGSKALDPVRLAKAQVHTDDYIDKVLGNYFYGEALPKDAEYMFPELRDNASSTDSGEQVSARRGRSTTQEVAAEVEPQKAAEVETPTPRRAAATADASPRRGRAAEKTEAPARAAAPRNILQDVEDND